MGKKITPETNGMRSGASALDGKELEDLREASFVGGGFHRPATNCALQKRLKVPSVKKKKGQNSKKGAAPLSPEECLPSGLRNNLGIAAK